MQMMVVLGLPDGGQSCRIGRIRGTSACAGVRSQECPAA
jgi:hypothetical protein